MAEISQVAEAAFTQANDQAPSAVAQKQPKDERTVYEVAFHIIPSVLEAEVEKVVAVVRDILLAQKVEMLSEKFPERMTLAYRIERSVSGKREKYSESYFGWMKCAGIPAAAPLIAAALRDMHDILRFIIVESTPDDAPAPRRAVFVSDRLEGTTIQKPAALEEKSAEISEEDLDKSIEALVS